MHEPHIITEDFYNDFGENVFTTDRTLETFKYDILNFHLKKLFMCRRTNLMCKAHFQIYIYVSTQNGQIV